MKIFKNVLNEQLYQECISDLTYKLKTNSWQSSFISWPTSVIEGVTGTCLVTPVDSKIYDGIYNQLCKLFPIPSKEIMIQYCAWHPYSGLSLHDDVNHVMGSTIYLNDNWNMNYGGVFMWKDKNDSDDIYRAISPQKNMMILNDEKELHMVTTISPLCPDLRATIQVWFN